MENYLVTFDQKLSFNYVHDADPSPQSIKL